MTAEQKLFLRLLADYVQGRPSEKPAGQVDWDAAAAYAEEQALGGILYVQCRDFLPGDSPALQRLHRQFFSAVYGAVNGGCAMAQAAERLERAGVDYMPFKGGVVKDYYPHPQLRTMGDLDVLVRERDKETADLAFRELGYARYVDNHAVWTYTQRSVMFEVHNVLFYEYLANSVDYRAYFGTIWDTALPGDGKGEYRPEPNRHFLYLLCHTAKHIINSGVGFRAYLDLVFMARQEKALDWNWLEGELERLELLTFARTCFALCRRWFGAEMPLEDVVLDEEFFREVTEKTFRDGTFGLHNEQNEAAHSAKEIRRAEEPYWKTTLALTVKKLFPPYRDMQLIPWYSFVDGRPWLLPVAWVYRWFYTAIHKFRKSRDLLTEPFLKRDVIERREAYIRRWGL